MVEISQRAADNRGPTEELTREMQRVAQAIEKYYHSLQQMQRHLIPRYLKNMFQFQANGTQVNLLYQSQQVIRVTSMIVVVSSAGLLQIGNFISMPVTPGDPPMDFGYDGMMIEPGQAIVLSQSNAGAIGIWCMGQEMASEGLRW